MKLTKLVSVALCMLCVLITACTTQPPPEQQSTLRDYSRELASQLMASGTFIRGGERIAVTSPVWLESAFDRSSLLALQIQEELSAELHRHHLDVVEFKLTDGIRVTGQGDFALSRNYLELRELQRAQYILAATTVEHANGIIINARLIDFHTQVVAATAQVSIPRHVVEDLRSEQGIELVSR